MRDFIGATASGRVQAAEFEHLQAGFFPGGPAAYGKTLRAPGPVKSIDLPQRFVRGGDTVVNYRVRLGQRPFRVGLSVTLNGRFSSYSLRPESPDDWMLRLVGGKPPAMSDGQWAGGSSSRPRLEAASRAERAD